MFFKIVDFENYEINKLGVVKNIKTQRVLKQHIDKYGYLRISIYHNDKKRKTLNTHRLLGIQFIPTTDYSLVIDHIDRNKLNNSLDNLRWCSVSENNFNRGEWTYSDKYKTGCILEKKNKGNNTFRLFITINKKQRAKTYKTREEAEIQLKRYLIERENFKF